MKPESILRYLSILYRVYLREALIQLIDNPNATWDDKIIQALDDVLIN